MYTTLILSGGGLKGICLLGALSLLHEQGHLENINLYIGTSVGTILNIFLLIGYTPREIIFEFVSRKLLETVRFNAVKGVNGDGFIDWEDIERILKYLILKKIQFIPTMKELYDTFKKEYRVISYNFNQSREICIDRNTFPNLSVLDAVHMSSNIPFVFPIFKHKEEIYFDGFLCNNFPINYIDKKRSENNLALYMSNAYSPQDKKWNLFFDVLLVPISQLQEEKSKPYQDHCKIYKINTNNLFELDCIWNNSILLNNFSQGYVDLKSLQKKEEEQDQEEQEFYKQI